MLWRFTGTGEGPRIEGGDPKGNAGAQVVCPRVRDATDASFAASGIHSDFSSASRCQLILSLNPYPRPPPLHLAPLGALEGSMFALAALLLWLQSFRSSTEIWAAVSFSPAIASIFTAPVTNPSPLADLAGEKCTCQVRSHRQTS